MKNFTPRGVIAGIAIVLAAFAIATACSKETTIARESSVAQKSTQDNRTTVYGVATYSAATEDFTFLFNNSEFEQIFVDSLLAKHGVSATIENIRIVDAAPFDSNYVGCIEVTFFDIDSAHTVKIVTTLSKIVNEEDKSTFYFLAPNARHLSVSCSSIGCGQGECAVVFDSHGTPIDCTSCSSKTCSKVIQATTTSLDGMIQFVDVLVDTLVQIGSLSKI